MSYNSHTMAALKEELASRGLSTNGKKADLTERLAMDDERIDRENGIILVHMKSLTGSFTTLKIHPTSTGSDLVNAFISYHDELYTADRIRVYLWERQPLDVERTLSDQGICNGCTLSFRVRLR